MAKVKKRRAVTANRKAGGKPKRRAPDGARKGSPTRKGKTGDRAPSEGAAFRIRALDPQARCGPRTSVERLYRVDESADGEWKPHLVFLDRHGWYCEHGRNCLAVPQARKFDDRHARENGRTHNGRMRA